MSKPKHTPGPWFVSTDTEETEPMIHDFKGNILFHSYFGGFKAEANARLIAAAPELLRELKAAIFYIETYGGDVTANFAAGGNLKIVKGVIAKAE